jgi:hypothetical protein
MNAQAFVSRVVAVNVSQKADKAHRAAKNDQRGSKNDAIKAAKASRFAGESSAARRKDPACFTRQYPILAPV